MGPHNRLVRIVEGLLLILKSARPLPNQIIPPTFVYAMERILPFCLLQQLRMLQGLESLFSLLSNPALTEIDQRRRWFYLRKPSDT